MLRRMNELQAYCRLEWLPSISDKPTRARSFQALSSMGKVFVPRNAGWKSELMGQLLRFPVGKYDDGVDVCSLVVVLWVVIVDMLRLCMRYLAGKPVRKLSEVPHEPSRMVENWVRD